MATIITYTKDGKTYTTTGSVPVGAKVIDWGSSKKNAEWGITPPTPTPTSSVPSVTTPKTTTPKTTTTPTTKPVTTPTVKSTVSPTVSPTPTPKSLTLTSGNLQQGSKGDNVKQIQSLLGVTQDGSFGPQTKSAVMAFQQANGLTVDGIVGPETLAALNKQGGTGTTTAPVTKTPTTTTKPTYEEAVANIKRSGGTLSEQNAAIAALATYYPEKAGTGDNINIKNEIEDINNEANLDQDSSLQDIIASMGEEVEVSDSSKISEALLSIYEKATIENPAETTTSLTEQLASKRAELGVDPLETQINDIDAQIAKLDSDWQTTQDIETNRKVSVTQINRRKSDEEIKYTQAKNELINQRNSIANTLKTKYDVIDTYMKYAESDYDNAVANYDKKYSQSMDLINLIKNIDETQKSDAEKTQDNAKANLQIILDTLSGTSYSSIDSSTQASITKMELQAGLPSGFTQFLLENSTDMEPVTSIGSEFTDASGNRQVPIYSKNPTTGMISVKTINIGTGAKTNTSEKDVFSEFIKTGKDADGVVFGAPMGSDGYADPDVYIAAFEAWTGTTAEFVSKFPPTKYVNPKSYKLLPAAIKPASSREL